MADSGDHGFLDEPAATPAAQQLYDGDVAGRGFVMNLSHAWAHEPGLQTGLKDLMGQAAAAGRLSQRQRAVLISAMASTLGDAYCSIAWGATLASETDPEAAAGVLRGDDGGLSDEADRALAAWARRVVRDPNGISADDVDELRSAGFDDRQILGITAFLAFRLAFSTVNDALGARPDRQLADEAPAPVRDAVVYGRPFGG